jgi:hypothetical protein
MRAIIAAALLLSVRILVPPSAQALEATDASRKYDAGDNPVIAWFINQWSAAGFAVPAQGETFTWNQYLSPVTDNRPQEGDLVRFTDKDAKSHMGLVVDASSDGAPVVKVPIGGGMVLLMLVDKANVTGYLRPHKKS